MEINYRKEVKRIGKEQFYGISGRQRVRCAVYLQISKKIGFFLLSSTSRKQYLNKKLTKLNQNHYVSCSTILFFFFFLFLSFSLSLRSFGGEKLPCCEINNVRHKLARSLLCHPSTMRSCIAVILTRFSKLGRRSAKNEATPQICKAQRQVVGRSEDKKQTFYLGFWVVLSRWLGR